MHKQWKKLAMTGVGDDAWISLVIELKYTVEKKTLGLP